MGTNDKRDGTNSTDRANRSILEASCPYCDGKADHQPWCATQDPEVYYAYKLLHDPYSLTLSDGLILHSLGVTWGGANRG